MEGKEQDTKHSSNLPVRLFVCTFCKTQMFSVNWSSVAKTISWVLPWHICPSLSLCGVLLQSKDGRRPPSAGHLQQQRRVLPGRLHPLCELPRSSQKSIGQRREVVTRVQHVGLTAFALLQPHEVRAGREEGPRALPVQLQDDARDAEHHPHCNHDVV